MGIIYCVSVDSTVERVGTLLSGVGGKFKGGMYLCYSKEACTYVDSGSQSARDGSDLFFFANVRCQAETFASFQDAADDSEGAGAERTSAEASGKPRMFGLARCLGHLSATGLSPDRNGANATQ